MGPGGAGWRSIGYGQGLEHRVVPAVNIPIICYKWLSGGVCAVGVVTWEKVKFFRHFATVLEMCDNFTLIATFLIKNSDCF